MRTEGRTSLAVICLCCALHSIRLNAYPSMARGLEWTAKMAEFVRPKADVLPDRSLIPEKNLLDPPPNIFTHELIRAEPYYYAGSTPSDPDGTLPVGTQVLLVREQEGGRCRVVDHRGLYVDVSCASLRRLAQAERQPP